MKKFTPALLLAFGIGCGGIDEQQLNQVERSLNAKIAQTAAEMDRKVTATDAKYAKMLAMEQKVANGLERIEQHAKLLETANDRMIQILLAQRNALKDQLASVEAQLEALQKK